MPWSSQNINNGAVSSGPAAAGDIGYKVFVCVYTDQQHFSYLDANGNIQDAWCDCAGNWHLQKINNGGMTPGPSAVGGLFVSVYNDQHHFSYLDADGNIQDCWYDCSGNWHLQKIN